MKHMKMRKFLNDEKFVFTGMAAVAALTAAFCFSAIAQTTSPIFIVVFAMMVITAVICVETLMHRNKIRNYIQAMKLCKRNADHEVQWYRKAKAKLEAKATYNMKKAFDLEDLCIELYSNVSTDTLDPKVQAVFEKWGIDMPYNSAPASDDLK